MKEICAKDIYLDSDGHKYMVVEPNTHTINDQNFHLILREYSESEPTRKYLELGLIEPIKAKIDGEIKDVEFVFLGDKRLSEMQLISEHE